MLDINKKQSDNFFEVVGILNSINVKEGTSAKTNDQWISCEADIRVDQEIGEKMTTNIIPVKLFANRHKKDGELNTNYDRITDYKENLIALASCDKGDEGKASKIYALAEVKENSFMSNTGTMINSFQFTTNFLNGWRAADEEGATFTVTGVVVKKYRETDKNGDETGKLIVKLCIVGYAGTANVIEFCAYGSKADYIDEHWQKGDTIKAAGYISFTNDVIEVTEEMGFGDPITKKKTISKRELIIDRGSAEGLDEAHSYDADDIKLALDKRQAYLASVEESAKKKTKPAASGNDFNF